MMYNALRPPYYFLIFLMAAENSSHTGKDVVDCTVLYCRIGESVITLALRALHAMQFPLHSPARLYLYTPKVIKISHCRKPTLCSVITFCMNWILIIMIIQSQYNLGSSQMPHSWQSYTDSTFSVNLSHISYRFFVGWRSWYRTWAWTMDHGVIGESQRLFVECSVPSVTLYLSAPEWM